MDKAEFDRFADEYAAMHEKSVALTGEKPDFFARYKIEEVARHLASENRRPHRILDFGAGVGNSLGPLRDYFPEAEIVLLDPSSKSLELAARRFPGMAEFRSFDGHNIPYPDNSFDLVFTACVFHHIPEGEHARLLGEISRILTADGNFFIFEHNPVNPLTLKAVRDCPFDDNAVLISPWTLKKRMLDAGMQKCRIAFRLFFPHILRALRPMERWMTWIPFGGQYYIRGQKSA